MWRKIGRSMLVPADQMSASQPMSMPLMTRPPRRSSACETPRFSDGHSPLYE